MKLTLTIIVYTIYFINTSIIKGQVIDSLKTKKLNEVLIEDFIQNTGGVYQMPDVKENIIYAGKKTEQIELSKINADLSTNNTRQIFAKVPGISIWENDGSGIQIGIASRGLSPNRSWEFNVRQNGYDISSDIFGYPESYYNPPMEAVSKIEVIKGASSLQFGPQFGGLVNYQLKKANPNKKVSFESIQTLGSYGLFNTYNSIGGTINKFSYYGFFHHRGAQGWRENSKYNINSGYLSLAYKFNSKVELSAEYTKMDYESQQPGGLTDNDYATNHQQSFRARNWFGTPWNVGSVNLKYKITESLNLNIKAFTVIAERNSVGFTKGINVSDVINKSTNQYADRQVDREFYKNIGAETRLTYNYNLGKNKNVLASGIRFYKGETNRNQLGVGSENFDFDLSVEGSKYGRELEFETQNISAFAENIFYLGKKIKIVPGIRFENISNSIQGFINTTNSGSIKSESRTRNLFLYGIGSEYSITSNTNFYSNYSLAFRPVTFSEITPSATTELVDPNLKDASGFNADFGYKGMIKNYLNFDVSAFYLSYENRIGTVVQNGVVTKTNIGSSVSKGVESFIEFNPIKYFCNNSKLGTASIFASNSIIDAKYLTWNNPLIANDPSKSIVNKRVENAPKYIHRFGLTYYYKGLSATYQISYVGDVYTDAANTEKPNAIGTVGKLNSYKVMDFSVNYSFLKNYLIKAGTNNLTDEKYATRRATGYPGPGILPGIGRTYFISFGIKI